MRNDRVLWVLLGVRVTTPGLHRLPPGEMLNPPRNPKEGGRVGGGGQREPAAGFLMGMQSKSPDTGRSSGQAP